jgi:hypothetical protein
MRDRWLRVGLTVLGAGNAAVGAWALFAPRSFYVSFPGGGRAWVAALPPYNEHLVRDVGSLNLALMVVLVFAAVSLHRTLVRAALVATLVNGIPHLIFHLANTGVLMTGDRVAQSVSLALVVAIPLVLLPLTMEGVQAVRS